MAAMLRAQRANVDGLLAAGRATAGLAGRVQDAVLALLRCADPADCVSGEMPGILAVDAAHLCVEAEQPGARRLPEGTVGRLLNGHQVIFRDEPADARLLHAEAAGLARHDALARVPGEGPPGADRAVGTRSVRAGSGTGGGASGVSGTRGGRGARAVRPLPPVRTSGRRTNSPFPCAVVLVSSIASRSSPPRRRGPRRTDTSAAWTGSQPSRG